MAADRSLKGSSRLCRDTTGMCIDVHGYRCRFGEQVVLDGVDLTVNPGEFVVLLGRSGCGKSTLLRSISGLNPSAESSGEILVSGQMAVLFQDARVLPWLSVIDNVRLGTPDNMDASRARAALAAVGLSSKAHAWPKVLSGGEQQRVALARAIMRNPGLILADEPFSALDALTRLRMQALLLDVYRRYHPAVLFVTHDVDEALLLASRIVMLDSGRVVYDRPNPARSGGGRGTPAFEAARREILQLLGVPLPEPA